MAGLKKLVLSLNPFLMKQLPSYLLDRFKAIGEQLYQSNPLTLAHFYIPNTNWHYFAFDYDPDLHLFSGYVTGIVNDFTFFHLLDLDGTMNAWGASVLDEYWLPIPFRKIKARLP